MGLNRIHKTGGSKPPVLGKLKIGTKDDLGIPRSLDYFSASGHYRKLFHDTLGEKPSKISIFFPKLPIEHLFFEQYEWWENGILMGKGDGEKWFLLQEDGYYIEKKTVSNPEKFKPSMRLGFCIENIQGVFGIWVFESKASKSTLENIAGTLDFIMNSGIEITEVKFDLVIEIRTKKLQKFTKKYPVVSLIPKSNDHNAEIVASIEKQLGENKLGLDDFN